MVLINKIKILLIIIIPIFLISMNVEDISLNPNFYHEQFMENRACHTFGGEVCEEMATMTTDYFKGRTDFDTELFTPNEKTHMKDVKIIIQTIDYLSVITLLTFFILAVVLFILKKEFLSTSLIIGGLITFLTITLISILSLLNFDQAFIIFHKIFFTNNLWLVGPESNMIKFYAPPFFQNAAKILFPKIAVSGTGLIVIGFILKKIEQN